MTKHQKIYQLSQKIVDNLFNVFNNSNYKNESFSWEQFPTMMQSLVSDQIYIIFHTHPHEKITQYQQEARDVIFQLAKDKINTSILYN